MNPPVVGEYRDRKTGLVVFGVFEIAAGAFCWLMVPLMAVLLVLPRRGSPPPPHLLPLMLGVYGLAGTVLIWLGVGSVLARRWARALWVCLSGVMFVTGVLVVPYVGYVTAIDLPKTMAAQGGPAMPPAVMQFTQIFVLGVMLILYIIIPGILLFFYASGNVKRTCEARDPQVRWTDRCPLPVLALSLFTAFGAATMLVLALFVGVFPLFGVFATGAAGRALMLLYGIVMLYAAWGVYGLRRSAWWLMLAVMVLMMLSSTLTMWHGDLRELYLRVGFEEQMAAQAGAMALRMKWVGVVSSVPWLIWVLYVRRYLPKAAAASIGT